jgi:putative salt-induced outer membrane protein YdiY
MKHIKISLLALMALNTIASAGDVAEKYTNTKSVEATKELKQSINLGFSGTSGNSDTLNVNGRYNLSNITEGYQGRDLKVALDASAFFTENNSVKNNEEFAASLGLEQMITNGWLGYAGVNWLRNPDFRNYDHKISIGLGAGKELFKDATQLLVAKLGTSYNIENYANAQPTKKFGALNEYLEYSNQLNSVSNFFFKVGSMQNFKDFSKDYEVASSLGANFAVGENINLTLAEEVVYDNLPPTGFKKTDTKTIATLGYNF